MFATALAIVGLVLSILALFLLVIVRRTTGGRLETLSSRLADLERPGTVPGSFTPVARAPGPRVRRVDSPGLELHRPVLEGLTLIAVPNLAAEFGPNHFDDLDPSDLVGRFGPIWDLAEAGASAETIARATGQPVGQVELILGLRRGRDAAGRP